MDSEMIESPLVQTVQKQLTGSKKHLLQIQNHIYGCFIIMEDIAQKLYSLSGSTLSGTNFTLDLDAQFAEIGIRFGFIMDTKLTLDTFLPEYKSAWLAQFASHADHDLDKVDAMEDALIDMIKVTVCEEDAFFLHALDKGTLPQEWVTKVLSILTLNTDANADANADASGDANTDASAEEKESSLSSAAIETKKSLRKGLHTTKRHVRFEEKRFGVTRRKT
jgi:hypothetical protein